MFMHSEYYTTHKKYNYKENKQKKKGWALSLSTRIVCTSFKFLGANRGKISNNFFYNYCITFIQNAQKKKVDQSELGQTVITRSVTAQNSDDTAGSTHYSVCFQYQSALALTKLQNQRFLFRVEQIVQLQQHVAVTKEEKHDTAGLFVNKCTKVNET